MNFAYSISGSAPLYVIGQDSNKIDFVLPRMQRQKIAQYLNVPTVQLNPQHKQILAYFFYIYSRQHLHKK